jgi:glycerol-3-phosphate acyltransferase PlsY
MDYLKFIGVLVISYLLGAIPFGLIAVWVLSGKDLRKVASGRTGGTNAMRAAGVPAGVATAVLDFFKGFFAVAIAEVVLPGHTWLIMFAPIAAILGHNYSIFLIERKEDGRLKMRGGAGGATCFGGLVGFWHPGLLLMLPIVAGIWYGVGYASVTTMSIAIVGALIFALRAWLVDSPWAYVLYGVLAELILVWALRPNLERLRNGNERLVGWRARHKKLPEVNSGN